MVKINCKLINTRTVCTEEGYMYKEYVFKKQKNFINLFKIIYFDLLCYWSLHVHVVIVHIHVVDVTLCDKSFSRYKRKMLD